jgi:hypothetical protein
MRRLRGLRGLRVHGIVALVTILSKGYALVDENCSTPPRHHHALLKNDLNIFIRNNSNSLHSGSGDEGLLMNAS